MKIPIVLTAIVLCMAMQRSKAQDTLYFDANWKESNSLNYAYYRLLPLKKEGDLLFVQDFYKNGNQQMQGYVLASNPEVYVGDIYWYDENGLDKSSKQIVNPSRNKVLTYYYPNGELWQKITYDNEYKKKSITVFYKGKEIAQGQIHGYASFSGTFIKQTPKSYYSDLDIEQDSEPIRTVQPQIIETVSPAAGASTVPKYSILTYWENGNLAQKDAYGSNDGYSAELINQMLYAKNGQLLNNIEINKSKGRGKHFVCNYYTRNNLAIELKDKISYLGYEKEGVSQSYDVNGKLLMENSYKEGVPYEGTFIKDDVNITEYTLAKGGKIGREITKTDDGKTIIAVGTYENGLPWEGTFFVNEDNLFVYSYRGGKLHGTQKVYHNYALTDLIYEYETIDGLKNGDYKVFKDDELKYTCSYKDDLPIDGVVIEGNNRLTYKMGSCIRKEEFSDDNFNHIAVLRNYVNDELHDISYFNFIIEDQKQDVYTGTYRNEKPFVGFFKTETIIDDIRIIAYYENGILIKEYSFDPIQQMEDYHFYNYNLTTVYEHNVPVSGPVYSKPDRSSYLTIYYQDHVPTKLEYNLFAMHYFNRITFSNAANELRITELRSPVEIHLNKGSNPPTITVYRENQIMVPSLGVANLKEGYPESATFYYLDGKEIKTYSMSMAYMDQEWGGDGIMQGLYLFAQRMASKTAPEIITSYVDLVSNAEHESKSRLTTKLTFPFEDEDLLSRVSYDKAGKISEGLQLKSHKNGTIEALLIRDSKIIKTHTFSSLADLMANEKAVFTALQQSLYE
ncbi:hypothetical protein [Sphingobacterium sp. MYb382]|uniref:hypothetical protein n=1 Tax=Sphingobacterium sp. MYb382 TaxID=2745278 RepID=UPI0030A31E41